MNRTLVAAAAALAASAAWSVPATVKTTNNVVLRGDVKWQRASKKYAMTYRSNGREGSTEITPGEIASLDVEKPPALDKLVAMVEKGQGATAAAGLAAIVNEYKMLVWDKQAARWLVEAYLAANNPKKAYETAGELIQDDKSLAWSGELAPAYWRALSALNKQTQLENCLRKAAASGDRAASAAALLMRGDIIVKNGADAPEAHRKALTDAYLRVALMYKDEPCKAVRAEALLKCADSFDKIQQSSRAEKLRAEARSL